MADVSGSRYPRAAVRPAPARRFVRIGVFAFLALLGLAAGAVLTSRGSPAEAVKGPPPALSRAGGPVKGETYQWQPVAIGGGGFITGFSSDARGQTRVVRTDVYGAYIWLDKENRWAQLVTADAMPPQDRVQDGANEGVYEIAVAPSDARRIYMAVMGRVYRSSDRGRTWQRPAEPGPFPFKWDSNSKYRHIGSHLAINPTDPDDVYFGTPANGVWHSGDGGMHWTKVASIPDSTPVAPQDAKKDAAGAILWFEPGKRRIWAMAQGNGMYLSTDGQTFRPLSDGPDRGPSMLAQGVFAPDGAFYGVDMIGKKVWAHHRDGWTDLTQASGLSARPFTGVAVDAKDGSILVFDQGGQPFRSGNGGKSWWRLMHRLSVGEGDPPWLKVADRSYFAMGRVYFDPVTPQRLWVDAGNGVYHADVSGPLLSVNWVSQTRGIEELVTNDVIQPPGGSPLFAAWDFGIHRKDDLNAWSTTYGPKERMLIAAQQLDWSPSNPRFVVTNASDTRMGCCSEDGDAVLAGYSLDEGRTWTKFASLPTPPGTKPDDPWRMAFGTIAVSSDSIDNIIWAPSFNRSPYYTMDRGKTWDRVEFPGEVLPYTGSHAQYFFPRKTLAADRVRPGTFYFVHSGGGRNEALKGLWRTTNGGLSWKMVYKGEIAPNSQYSARLRAVFGKEGNLFFTSSVAMGPDTGLRRTADGGETWTVVPNVSRVDDIGFGKAAPGADYPAIFISGQVAGQYGIWRSIDNAKSWQRLAGFPMGTLDQVGPVEGDKDVFGRVYVGYKGSSWLYGEPAPCQPAPFRQGMAKECVPVE